jgi:phosphonopyruvate decarboxylase
MISRLEAIQTVFNEFKSDATYFVTTGKASREFLLNDVRKLRFFPCVGGMGHVSSIAYSYARISRNLTLCIDGDGSFLMHLGSVSGFEKTDELKFVHIILDNGIHQSVGGGRTNADKVNFERLSEAFAYDTFTNIFDTNNLLRLLKNLEFPGKHLIRVKIDNSELENLPRPNSKMVDFIDNFRLCW